MLLVAAVSAATLSTLVTIEEDLHPSVLPISVVGLAVVAWWATGRAVSGLPSASRSAIDAFIWAGVRWGATAAAIYWFGALTLLILFGGVAVFFFETDGARYNMVGGRYAFAVVPLVVALPGALVAVSIGAALGGVIAIIDRGLVAVAHWVFGEASSR